MVRIVCLAALLSAALAPAADAAGRAATVRALDRQMNRAGTGSGAYVVDLDSGATLYARAGDVPRIPASVNKLYTTSAALVRYGDQAQLDTDVLGDAQPDEGGVLKGNLYLRGGGDPEFGPAQARGLARVLADSGLKKVTRRVIGDESRFDRLRGGPDSNYGTSIWVGPLSALPFNHGLLLNSTRRFQKNPPYYAARAFERELESAGVKVRWHARAGVAPTTAQPLGEWGSARMSVLIRHTNRPSDNYMAETLLKDLGADFGGAGTTAAGTVVARREAAKYGAQPTMVDGSGLSRQNRTTPHDVVRLLAGLDATDEADPMRISLAVAGKSGTLSDRMRRGPARGRCRAKTGTLNGVSNLAGYCTSRSGARLAFAFLMSGVSVYTAHPIQDRMAQVLARYTSSSSSP
jgi:D-alanyl-D-alanine carboxypeptidase/D-alanyl-D-alanine-endopeptidase (penicillin-binding protein 4)